MANISVKRFRKITHSYAASFSIKASFCETNNIFYSSENQNRDKTNAWFWKYIKNKCKVTLDVFQNFAYDSSFFAFKKFCMETRLYNNFKIKNITMLSKPILKSPYKALSETILFVTLRRPVNF